MFLRVGLFLLTNLAILVVAGIIFSIFGVQYSPNMSMPQLLTFCAIFGFTGSFVSLALSKFIALKSTHARVIEQPQTRQEQWLVETVRELASKAKIGMPTVAIYPSQEVNAFATGMRRDKALVAVSEGILRQMNEDQVKAVLAHEVSHIANGDMVTLTLIQGVVNTFVMFFARVVGAIVDRTVFGNREGRGVGYFLSVIVLEIIFGILASTIVMWFSRRREFRADAGAAYLYNPQSMISALQALKRNQEESDLPKAIQAFGISGGQKAGWMKLFMSHPPLDERIAALTARPM